MSRPWLSIEYMKFTPGAALVEEFWVKIHMSPAFLRVSDVAFLAC